MLVPIVAGLLDENHLIDTHCLELLQIGAHLVRVANATSRAADTRTLLLEVIPNVKAAGYMRPGDVVMRQRVPEEMKTLESTLDSHLAIFVTHEASYHGDVRIDCTAKRLAFVFERRVVLVDPVLRLARVDECEGQGPDAQARGQTDGVSIRARHPQRRMRRLQRFGNDVAMRHREV